MTTTFSDRKTLGFKEESDFLHWVNAQVGWECLPYGQGLLPDKTKDSLKHAAFNGDAELLELIICRMPSDMRNVYMDFYPDGFPIFMRWLPDWLITFRGSAVFTADSKTGATRHLNWAIEMSSLLGGIIQQLLGVPSVYVFPPAGCRDYRTVASPNELIAARNKVFDGKNAIGSGTPYITVPKRDVACSLRHLMTKYEQGAAVIDGIFL